MSETRRPLVTTFKNNYRVRMFSVRKRLSRDLEHYNHPIDASEVNYDNFQSGIKNEAYLLAERLFEIEGVQGVSVDVYDVWVIIGKAFSWEELEGAIISRIMNYINAKKVW